MKKCIINHCWECTNYNKDAVVPYCDKSEEIIVNPYNIPKWCKLEDA